jgi:hypothetical protein
MCLKAEHLELPAGTLPVEPVHTTDMVQFQWIIGEKCQIFNYNVQNFTLKCTQTNRVWFSCCPLWQQCDTYYGTANISINSSVP